MVNPLVEAYAEAHSTELPSHLQSVDETTRRKFPMWQMMVGREEGRLLEMLVFATRAQRVLEIGTFTGFSALAMAAGLPPGGSLVSCEVDPKHAAEARSNIEVSPYAERIDIREGPALETVAELDGPFDLVFFDADKTGYDAYFEAVLPKLAPRGLVVLDNTLMNGNVLEDSGGESAEAVRRLNDKLVADPRVVCVLTTVRDGVTIVRRANS